MTKRSHNEISNTSVGYNDLPDLCKDLIAEYVYTHLCRGIPGHYLDMPVSEELMDAGMGNMWVESGDSDMVRSELDNVFN